MKNIFLILLFNLLLSIHAQNVNPDLVRVKIYDTIVNDINKHRLASINKQIVIDPTINKFEDYKLNEFGVKLDSVKYDPNLKFCTKTSVYKCVTKFEIDQYKVVNVYKDQGNAIHPDFYGIYAPLDSWYNLIYYSMVKHFEKDKTFQFDVVIPVRNVWISEKEMKEQIYFYQFKFDERFKILKFEKLFLKH